MADNRVHDWTPERVAKLKALWNDGLSASEIAKGVGGITRNSVIGKAARLGLTRTAAETALNRARGDKKRAARRAPSEPTAPKGGVKAVSVSGGWVYPQADSEPLPPERPHDGVVVPMEQLGAHSCRWPVGTPGTDAFGFCGARRPDGATYCREHAKRAHAPTPKRARSTYKDDVRRFGRLA